MSSHLPAFINKNDKVILFDGVCKLCNAWARFIIKFDKTQQFKLASVQSKQGKVLLKHFALPTQEINTMVLIHGNNAYTKSEAFFQVIKYLSIIFRVVLFFKFLPIPLSDWLYDRIALNRYKLFGKYSSCLMPTADSEKRFLK